jgi:hypothetical protein
MRARFDAVATAVASSLLWRRRLGLLAVLLVGSAGDVFAHAVPGAGAWTASPSADGGAPSTGETRRPVCVRVGTRSEGWAWPNGGFIHWAKCKGVVPKCRPAAGDKVEGWYGNGVLIAPDRCAK